MFANSLKLK